MSYFEEKPKNDFEKPKNTFDNLSPDRERGGCLSAFLIFVIAVNVIFLVALCVQTSQVSRYSSAAVPILAVGFGIQAVVLSCAVAVWNWKKWGFYGLVIAYCLQIVLQLCSGNFVGVISAGVGMVILFSLVNDKLDMFD